MTPETSGIARLHTYSDPFHTPPRGHLTPDLSPHQRAFEAPRYTRGHGQIPVSRDMWPRLHQTGADPTVVGRLRAKPGEWDASTGGYQYYASGRPVHRQEPAVAGHSGSRASRYLHHGQRFLRGGSHGGCDQ